MWRWIRFFSSFSNSAFSYAFICSSLSSRSIALCISYSLNCWWRLASKLPISAATDLIRRLRSLRLKFSTFSGSMCPATSFTSASTFTFLPWFSRLCAEKFDYFQKKTKNESNLLTTFEFAPPRSVSDHQARRASVGRARWFRQNRSTRKFSNGKDRPLPFFRGDPRPSRGLWLPPSDTRRKRGPCQWDPGWRHARQLQGNRPDIGVVSSFELNSRKWARLFDIECVCYYDPARRWWHANIIGQLGEAGDSFISLSE